MSVVKDNNDYWCPKCGYRFIAASSAAAGSGANTTAVSIPTNSSIGTSDTTSRIMEISSSTINDAEKQENNTNSSSSPTSIISNALLYGGAVAAGVCVIPIVAGFGTGGIVGGSLAAAWQSSIGNVAAGSLFAGLQSAGATGALSAGAACGGTASATGFLAKHLSSWHSSWSKKEATSQQEEEGETSPVTTSTTKEEDVGAEDQEEEMQEEAPESQLLSKDDAIRCPFCKTALELLPL